MKLILKIIGTVILIIFMLISLLAGYFVYKTEYRKEHLYTYTSPDRECSLEIYQIGEPDWPFGSVKGRIVLKKGITPLYSIDFTQHNDGGGVYIEEDNIFWCEDSVRIIVRGEGQENTYTVNFNGTYSVKPQSA